jgi:hypothetical protein
VLLYGGGLPVTVPRAEAYAVHKLIVAVDRINQAKSAKDTRQAQILIEALAIKRPAELAASWNTACSGGRQWRKKLESGKARLSNDAQTALAAITRRA